LPGMFSTAARWDQSRAAIVQLFAPDYAKRYSTRAQAA
jgi:hypothetical protein